MDALLLANYIIGNYADISPLKLQKLLYYVKVWGIVSNEDLLSDDFEKWQHGPVNPPVYQEFKKFGKTTIPQSIAENVVLEEDKKPTIDFILNCYAPYDAITLSAMTHEDEPWKKTPVNNIISKKAIAAYYSKLQFAKNFPFDPKKPFYPVQTDMHYAYIFDMTPKEVENAYVYSSYAEYKYQMQQAKTDFEKWLTTVAKSK